MSYVNMNRNSSNTIPTFSQPEILKRIAENRLIDFCFMNLDVGAEYFPIRENAFDSHVLTSPKVSVRITELCDGYYESDFTSGDLEAFASAIMDMAKTLRSLEMLAEKEQQNSNG